MARRDRHTPEELALIKAQTARLGQESALSAQELAQKAALARAQIASEQEMNASRVGLGREEMTSKDKQAKLGAALEALSQDQKAKIATQGEKGALLQDLTHRADIPQDVLARTLAQGGSPELFNALAKNKLDKENTAIRSFIPAIQGAKSDAEREKKLMPGLESIRPGAYKEALALAYPKEGQVAPSATPEPAPVPTNAATNGNSTNPLAATLLAAAGFGGGQGGNGATDLTTQSNAGLPLTTPETRYTPLGHGSLEGSTPVEGGIQTPSGGFIGTNGISSGLAKLIAPRGTDSASLVTNAATPTIAGTAPTIDVPLVEPKPYDFGALLANNGGPQANPTPTPATPVPVQGPTAEQLAALAVQEQQRKLREAATATY